MPNQYIGISLPNARYDYMLPYDIPQIVVNGNENTDISICLRGENLRIEIRDAPTTILKPFRTWTHSYSFRVGDNNPPAKSEVSWSSNGEIDLNAEEMLKWGDTDTLAKQFVITRNAERDLQRFNKLLERVKREVPTALEMIEMVRKDIYTLNR